MPPQPTDEDDAEIEAAEREIDRNQALIADAPMLPLADVAEFEVPLEDMAAPLPWRRRTLGRLSLTSLRSSFAR